ncbi:MAG: nitrophenyl compound nitroreductase subunit ArsF family protein [Candidatus Aureabacteria bacterium]|nr:nitrophenyl compound nitroreductase subunit ArsF family protein [Candidatus Auribacterota bacterium]
MSVQLKQNRRNAWTLLVVFLFLSACMASGWVKERLTGGMASAMPEKGMVAATYFHGTIRCQACLEIEKLSKAALERQFSSELASGALVWKSIDYDQPQNNHYFKHYQLPHPSLVISRFQNGQKKEWKILGKTWDLVDKDPDALMSYVQEEVLALLARGE